jgi:hypothetical protein
MRRKLATPVKAPATDELVHSSCAVLSRIAVLL